MAPPAVSHQVEAAAALGTPTKVYSKENEQLVKKSWEVLKKDAQRNGINFFRKVFEIAPGAKAMYSFMRDSTIPFEENPKVKNHARSVFLMTGDAAVQLGEKGIYQALDSRLQKLAATHIKAGVTDDQFDVTVYNSNCCRFEFVPKQNDPGLKFSGDGTQSVLIYFVLTLPQIVKEAILYAVEMGVPELWSPELKSAWGDAYDQIAAAVKAEMSAQRTAAAQ